MATICDINDEWEKFLSVEDGSDNNDDYDEFDDLLEEIKQSNEHETFSKNVLIDQNTNAPKATDIYISTKTKLLYLNKTIELKKIFWSIPIMDYSLPATGVVQKQMKVKSNLIEEYEEIQNNLKNIPYYDEHVIIHINNPMGKIKFKDVRKISIGISKKDVLSHRRKKKSAFYNCFVLMLRLNYEGEFKEFHVKVFNTGKIEFPGIKNAKTFTIVQNEVIHILQPYFEDKLEYKSLIGETVLINSNFNCGFYVKRDVLSDLLKYKYNIQSMYDPSSYPGIQCKFYFNPSATIQNGCQISDKTENNTEKQENKKNDKSKIKSKPKTNVVKVSFMIFRTGSVLIVGKCDESVLMIVYEYLKKVLNNEYKLICQRNIDENETISNASKNKNKKQRKKRLMIERPIVDTNTITKELSICA